jgi:uncharacterized protein
MNQIGANMSIPLILAVVFVVFLGALTRTTFGFGEAVVSMPLLTLLPVNLHTSVSLMGLVGLTVASLAITTGWCHINRWALIPLVFAALVGIPIGLVMVTVAPTKVMTGFLGMALIAYGIYSLTRHFLISTKTKDRLQHPLWGLLFGFASGLFGSAYNFNGVPVAVYSSLRGWHPNIFRSTMQAYFFISGALIVAGQEMSGMWNVNMFTLYLFSLPAIVAAIVVGTILHRKIPTAKFQRYVFLLIATLGVVLFVKSII